jgi:hypothetical protein
MFDAEKKRNINLLSRHGRSFANKVSPTLASHQTTTRQRAAVERGKTTVPCAYQSEVDCLKILCIVFLHASSRSKAVRRKAGIRCSSSQTIVCWCNTAANQVEMVHPTEDFPLRDKLCLKAGTGNLVMKDKQQHNQSLHDEYCIDLGS